MAGPLHLGAEGQPVVGRFSRMISTIGHGVAALGGPRPAVRASSNALHVRFLQSRGRASAVLKVMSGRMTVTMRPVHAPRDRPRRRGCPCRPPAPPPSTVAIHADDRAAEGIVGQFLEAFGPRSTRFSMEPRSCWRAAMGQWNKAVSARPREARPDVTAPRDPGTGTRAVGRGRPLRCRIASPSAPRSRGGVIHLFNAFGTQGRPESRRSSARGRGLERQAVRLHRPNTPLEAGALADHGSCSRARIALPAPLQAAERLRNARRENRDITGRATPSRRLRRPCRRRW